MTQTKEQIAEKYAEKLFNFYRQVGILDEPSEEDTESDLMYRADIRWQAIKAIQDSIAEYSASLFTEEEIVEIMKLHLELNEDTDENTKWFKEMVLHTIQQFKQSKGK